MSFDDLLGDSVRIEKSYGSVLGPFKAAIHSDSAQLPLREALIDDGDILIRELPGSKEQRYVIEDASYTVSPDQMSIPSFYELTLRKEGKPPPNNKSSYNVNIGTVQGPTMIGDSNVQQVQNEYRGTSQTH